MVPGASGSGPGEDWQLFNPLYEGKREKDQMTDIVEPRIRSRMMAGIGGKNTQPELRVRSYLHGTGLRFSLHRHDLPGRPDIVLAAFGAVVLVHGCFWHRHPGCRFATNPATRKTFWEQKFRANVTRDQQVSERLKQAGWRVITIWECETRDEMALDQLFWRILAGCSATQNAE